jgi:hypothetical protein
VAAGLPRPPRRLLHERPADPETAEVAADYDVLDRRPGPAVVAQVGPDHEQVDGPGDGTIHGCGEQGAVGLGGYLTEDRLPLGDAQLRSGTEALGELLVEVEESRDVGDRGGPDLDADGRGLCLGRGTPREGGPGGWGGRQGRRG